MHCIVSIKVFRSIKGIWPRIFFFFQKSYFKSQVLAKKLLGIISTLINNQEDIGRFIDDICS